MPKFALAGTLGAALLIVLIVGCQSSVERIRGGGPGSEQLTAVVYVTNLQTGDCMTSFHLRVDRAGQQTDQIDRVTLVPCKGEWEYKVVGSFEAPAEAHLILAPATFVATLYTSALGRCDASFDLLLYAPPWGTGDRKVHCLLKRTNADAGATPIGVAPATGGP